MNAARAVARGLLLAAGAVGAAACSVGSGAGAATGELYIIGCNSYPDAGTADAPVPFSLNPTFFAGEPIEDISPGDVHANRLVIRMQRTGNGIEINDVLFFDVQNAYEVARCLRGRIVDGVPDWDQRRVSDLQGQQTGPPWCDWGWSDAPGEGGVPDGGTVDAAPSDGGVPDGGAAPGTGAAYARIHLGPLEYVRSYMWPYDTCQGKPRTNLVGTAIDGWIDFREFGSAMTPDVPPDQRVRPVADFKVNFDEYLSATFHVQLEDERVSTAIQQRRPPPAPLIGGVLDGFFDFQLDRGRAAQPFP